MNLIYGLVDPRDGRIRYIGKSSRGLLRPPEHWNKKGLSRTTHLGRWVKKIVSLGLLPEVIVVEESLDELELGEAEVFWISYFRFVGASLVNMTLGGDGGPCSEESRKKISRANKGRTITQKHREAISAAHKGKQHRKGKKLSDEQKAMISATHRGRPHSEDHRRKISESNKGRTSYWKGKSLPEEVKVKMRESYAKRIGK